MITLYDLSTRFEQVRFSPFCWRVKLALAHKGLVWEEVPISFTQMNALPEPSEGKVPVLVDDGEVVCDSWNIALFLDDKYANNPLFEGDESRSQSFFIKVWMESLQYLVSRMGVLDFYSLQGEAEKQYFRTSRERRYGMTLEEWGGNSELYRDELSKRLEPLRQAVAVRPFLGGEAPNFSDHIVFGTFQWLRCAARTPLLEKEDVLYQYRDRLLDLYGGLGRSAPEYSSVID